MKPEDLGRELAKEVKNLVDRKLEEDLKALIEAFKEELKEK